MTVIIQGEDCYISSNLAILHLEMLSIYQFKNMVVNAPQSNMVLHGTIGSKEQSMQLLHVYAKGCMLAADTQVQSKEIK